MIDYDRPLRRNKQIIMSHAAVSMPLVVVVAAAAAITAAVANGDGGGGSKAKTRSIYILVGLTSQ